MMPALLASVLLVQGVSCVSAPLDDPRAARAEAFERVGSWSDAAGLWTQIYFDSGFRDVEAGRLAARASLVAGRPDDALVRLDDLLAREPGDPRLLEMRGSAREALSQPAAARVDYEAALAVEPNLPRALARLGALEVAAGRVEEGLELLTRGVALDPSDLEAQFGLGVALAGAGDPGGAAGAFDAAFGGQTSVSAASLGQRLDAARLLGSHPACAAWLAPLLAANPQHTEALWRIGQSEISGGRRADGLRHLERAAESDPGDVAALSAFAAALLLEGRDDDAQAIIDHARGLDLTPEEAALLEGLGGPHVGEPQPGVPPEEDPGSETVSRPR